MADPHWTGYVGMATGIVGALAGITGAVLGVVSFRRTTAVKKLDLRLELRKALNKLDADVAALSQQLPYANKSRERVAAAKGMRDSGAMQAWATSYSADTAALESLRNAAKGMEGDFSRSALADLEAKLSAIHKLQLQADQLGEKYRASLAADDEDRAFLRDAAHRGVTRGN